jgi:hypothetical protein
MIKLISWLISAWNSSVSTSSAISPQHQTQEWTNPMAGHLNHLTASLVWPATLQIHPRAMGISPEI